MAVLGSCQPVLADNADGMSGSRYCSGDTATSGNRCTTKAWYFCIWYQVLSWIYDPAAVGSVGKNVHDLGSSATCETVYDAFMHDA